MMQAVKTFVLLAVLTLALTIPVHHAAAQSSAPTTGSSTFDTTGFPQWAKDMRRFDIVAFGSFPFAMFATTFFMDTRRWIDANSMDFSEEGRRYAPWPFKSAGAVAMTNKEQETTLLIAAGLSVAVAFTDLIIVQIKRRQEQRRAERLPEGDVIINKRPWPEGGAAGNGADSGGESAPALPAAP
ncbi:MAG: hypothetical protein LBC88_08585 [Spirochaetaceae bacterium]|jgi:hypothetical protein|nr:hypothetical protein [Spirochaetaceae bacterium]